MPYKYHKLVKRSSYITEYRIKKKKFNLTSFKKKKLYLKMTGVNKSRASRAASKFKRKTTLKPSFFKRIKAKSHRILTNRTLGDLRISTQLYIKKSN